MLSCRISNGKRQPYPQMTKPLLELPVPKNSKLLKRALGMFAYYAQWISQFLDKIKPLVITSKFSYRKEAVYAFNVLKNDLVNVTLEVIDDELAFTLETDASDVAISVTLNEKKRPIAFYSKTLNCSEVRQSSVEKEACAIVETIRHWSHFLQEHHFKLVTDQRSVAFMYDNRRHSKI